MPTHEGGAATPRCAILLAVPPAEAPYRASGLVLWLKGVGLGVRYRARSLRRRVMAGVVSQVRSGRGARLRARN